MIVTIDTNVIYSGLYSKKGASHFILKLVLNEKLKVAISTQTYFEYYDVLTRKENLEQLKLTVNEIEDFLDLFALLAQKYDIYYLLRPNLKDESDNMFVECAFASNSEFLITGNSRDFKKGELKGFNFNVITPSNFYKVWRTKNE